MQYLVVVNTDPIEGSGMAAAEHQGTGEEFLKAYLERKMPAGSPVQIHKVIQINPGP